MRKITLLIMSLFLTVGAMAQLKTDGTKYCLKLEGTEFCATFMNTGLADTDAGAMQLQTISYTENQIFTLVAAAETDEYYIKCKNGYYITQETWNPQASEEPETAFTIIETAEGSEVYTIYQDRALKSDGTSKEAWKGYFGFDAATATEGQNLYTNQPLTAQKINWIFEEVSDENLLKGAKADLTAVLTELHDDMKVDDEEVGYYKMPDGLKTAVDNGKYLLENSTDVDDITDATKELRTLISNLDISNLEINLPVAGKYYNLIGSTGNYLTGQTSTSNTKKAKMCMPDNYDASYVFYYTGSKLVSFSNGYCLNDLANFGTLEASAPVVTFTKTSGTNTATDGTLYMMIGEKNIHDWSTGDASKTNHTGINKNFDATSCWTIKEATKLPVTITDAQYATFYAPVAVSMPDEGVTAHTVTINGNLAILSEAIETVPAEAGVILAGNEGTYNLTITEGVDAIEGALAGTVAKTVITKADNTSYYVLGKDSEGNVGLYNPVNGTTTTQFINNGHKAYLVVEGTNGAPAFYGFDFGGETTAIEEVKTENGEVKTIYDLTGRRVEKITEAGIYIVNGKKVLVK